MTSKTMNRFSPEVRALAGRMARDHEPEYGARWATVESTAGKIGATAQTLNEWVKTAERDGGHRAGPTGDAATKLLYLALPPDPEIASDRRKATPSLSAPHGRARSRPRSRLSHHQGHDVPYDSGAGSVAANGPGPSLSQRPGPKNVPLAEGGHGAARPR